VNQEEKRKDVYVTQTFNLMFRNSTMYDIYSIACFDGAASLVDLLVTRRNISPRFPNPSNTY
jgi:hypothetical protein